MLNWDQYISSEIDDELIDRCRAFGIPMFQQQKENLVHVSEQLNPKTVACLGAGGLNDIPTFEFFRSADQVYLVDWIANISEESFKACLIENTPTGATCKVCGFEKDPQSICSSFAKEKNKESNTCDNYMPLQSVKNVNRSIRCSNFIKGSRPTFVTSDITSSRSTEFAKSIEPIFKTTNRPEDCFRKAIRETIRCEEILKPMPIPSDSVDLVTSSMVVSQFDIEPYEFFSKNLVARFGSQSILDAESKLKPLALDLRNRLFLMQAEGHIKDIYRILNKKSGKLYFSVELFQSVPKQEGYFIVSEVLKAMSLLNKFFTFDFNLMPPSRTFQRIRSSQENEFSVIQSYVLTPIPTKS